jgi:hypothetical protein
LNDLGLALALTNTEFAARSTIVFMALPLAGFLQASEIVKLPIQAPAIRTLIKGEIGYLINRMVHDGVCFHFIHCVVPHHSCHIASQGL